jgi:hypothetical protein
MTDRAVLADSHEWEADQDRFGPGPPGSESGA